MSQLNLFDEAGRLKEDAYLQFEAVCLYPDDAVSRQNFLMVAVAEQERCRRIGNRDFQFSTVYRSLEITWAKPLQPKAIAGFVVLALRMLQRHAPHTVSRSKAARLALTIMENLEKRGDMPVTVTKRKGGHLIREQVKVASSKKAARERFNRHNSVAHLFAAQLIVGTSMDQEENWPVVAIPDSFRAVVATAIHFQDNLLNSYPELFPDAWRLIPPNDPDFVSNNFVEPLAVDIDSPDGFDAEESDEVIQLIRNLKD